MAMLAYVRDNIHVVVVGRPMAGVLDSGWYVWHTKKSKWQKAICHLVDDERNRALKSNLEYKYISGSNPELYLVHPVQSRSWGLLFYVCSG